MKLIDEQLLKCLQCRLAGSPPKFNLPPPPPPPAFIDSLFNDNSNNKKFDFTDFNKDKLIRRCLRLKAMLNPSSTEQLDNSPSLSLDSGVRIEQSSRSFLDFTSTESLYLFFLICTILFVIVLIVAIVFIIKLIKIKKHLNKSQSDSQISKSTFLTNSSTVSSSNTINSQLSSLKESDSQLYNQLFNHQRINNQYFPAPQNKAASNSEDYTEISSQVYLDTAYLEKLKQNCHNMALGHFNGNTIRNSGAYLVANSHQQPGGLVFLNQFPIQQQQQTNGPNMYYAC